MPARLIHGNESEAREALADKVWSAADAFHQ